MFVSLIFILLLVFFKSYLKSYFYYSLNPNFKLPSPYIHYIILCFHHYYTIFCIFLHVTLYFKRRLSLTSYIIHLNYKAKLLVMVSFH